MDSVVAWNSYLNELLRTLVGTLHTAGAGVQMGRPPPGLRQTFGSVNPEAKRHVLQGMKTVATRISVVTVGDIFL